MKLLIEGYGIRKFIGCRKKRVRLAIVCVCYMRPSQPHKEQTVDDWARHNATNILKRKNVHKKLIYSGSVL